jgi:hypothetical protein
VQETRVLGENTDLPQVTNKLYHIMLWCIYIVIYIYHGIVWFWALIKWSKKLVSHFNHWPNNFFLCTLSARFAFGKLFLDQLYYWWQKISTRAKKGIIIRHCINIVFILQKTIYVSRERLRLISNNQNIQTKT